MKQNKTRRILVVKAQLREKGLTLTRKLGADGKPVFTVGSTNYDTLDQVQEAYKLS